MLRRSVSISPVSPKMASISDSAETDQIGGMDSARLRHGNSIRSETLRGKNSNARVQGSQAECPQQVGLGSSSHRFSLNRRMVRPLSEFLADCFITLFLLVPST
jgi:hypothetical protein